MYWWFGPGHVGLGWVGLIVGGLIWILVVALLVALVVRLVRGPRRGYWMPGPPPGWGPSAHPDDPEQVLRTRFARGEIGPEEFQQRLDVLRRTQPPQG